MDKKSQKLNTNKNGIKLIRVAAFGFALVSWYATAQGLNEYVFNGHVWQAVTVSFAIQSTLFVLNLKLPLYFSLIGDRVPKKEKKHRKYLIGKKRRQNKQGYKWTGLQKIIAFFYGIVIFSSSFFSFVYMTNLVYKDTKYIDANIIVDRVFRTNLNETEQYVDELEKATLLVMSKLLSDLELTAKDKSDSEKTIEELEAELSNLKNIYEDKLAEKIEAESIFYTAKQIYETPMNLRWRSPVEYEKEKRAYENANGRLTTAIKEMNLAKKNLRNVKDDIKNYIPPLYITIHDLFVEILKPNIDISVLGSLSSNLNERILKKNNGTGTVYSTDIILKVQKLTIIIKNYITLKEAISKSGEFNDLNDLRNSLNDSSIVIPEVDSETQQISKWEKQWKELFFQLENIIKTIPRYSSDIVDSLDDHLVLNTQTLEEYNVNRITKRIDRITRINLYNINPLERACQHLVNNYSFLAWFSLILALYFDCASLLAGLFIYFVTVRKVAQELEEEKQI